MGISKKGLYIIVSGEKGNWGEDTQIYDRVETEVAAKSLHDLYTACGYDVEINFKPAQDLPKEHYVWMAHLEINREKQKVISKTDPRYVKDYLLRSLVGKKAFDEAKIRPAEFYIHDISISAEVRVFKRTQGTFTLISDSLSCLLKALAAENLLEVLVKVP